MNIGILALQGAVREHARAVRNCGALVKEIRQPRDISEIDGLIIPGGESTTIGKLAAEYELIEPLKALAAKGVPVFGTCAGLILLAKRVVEGDQPLLRLMDIVARRNAFGRQTDSFETEITIPILGAPSFHAVFIRAPWIESVGLNVRVLAKLDINNGQAKIVLAEEDNLLVSAFHPELTDDRRLHRYFLEKVRKFKHF